MKYAACLSFLLLTSFAWANMTSPVQEGDRGLKSITSKEIDIIDEQINISISRAFQGPQIAVTYKIFTPKSGKQIPLLFVALGGYSTQFTITCNEQRVESQQIPSSWVNDNPDFLNGFSEAWLFTKSDPQDEIFVDYDSTGNEYQKYQLYELSYFEVELDSGYHEIKIEYGAVASEDRSDPVKKYELYYSLSPALYWKSFGGVTINVKSEISTDSLSFNIPFTEKVNNHELVFRIDTLNRNFFNVSYHPPLPKFAAKLLAFGNVNLALLAGILLAIAHVLWNRNYRKKSTRKFSIVVLIGSFIVPILILWIYVQSFNWIDLLIGRHASAYHGYTFISFIFYPILVLLYGSLIWLVDRFQRKNKPVSE